MQLTYLKNVSKYGLNFKYYSSASETILFNNIANFSHAKIFSGIGYGVFTKPLKNAPTEKAAPAIISKELNANAFFIYIQEGESSVAQKFDKKSLSDFTTQLEMATPEEFNQYIEQADLSADTKAIIQAAVKKRISAEKTDTLVEEFAELCLDTENNPQAPNSCKIM